MVMWKPLPGAEGRYDVSHDGQVRSWLRSRSGPLPRLMAQVLDDSGHPIVCLTIDGRRQVRTVHSLMLLTFVGPRPEGLQTRHLDGVPTHNVIGNLAYGTHSENMLDRVRHGVHHQAIKTHCPRNHPYDDENTRYARKQRVCRACERDRMRESMRERRRAAQ